MLVYFGLRWSAQKERSFSMMQRFLLISLFLFFAGVLPIPAQAQQSAMTRLFAFQSASSASSADTNSR